MAKITNVEVFKFIQPPRKPQPGVKPDWDKPNYDRMAYITTKSMPRMKETYAVKTNKGVLTSGAGTGGAAVVKITTEDGIYGYGSTGLYNVAASFIYNVLRPLIIGLDAMEIEKIWDVMFRVTSMYGRKGMVIQAISAVDIALWDIMGKTMGLPVYQLLGGKVRDKIKVYATGNDLERYARLGYKANKIPAPAGPGSGKEGIKLNVMAAERVARIMGEDAEIMYDCWQGWDVEFTVKVCKELKKLGLNVRWIEEPLMADDIMGHRRLKDLLNPMGILVTTGEHEYTRWGARELIENQAIDIMQCDIWYSGGISEMRKMLAYAKAHNVYVVPHCNGMPVYHVSISSLQSPFAETLVLQSAANDANRLFLGEPQVIDGYLDVPDRPGLGYELNYEWGRMLPYS